MPDQKHMRLNFGFRNTAQDRSLIKDFDAWQVNALDADQLALGTLTSSDYDSVLEGTAALPDRTSANLGGTNFRLNGNTLEYEANIGWQSFNNVFGSASAKISAVGLSDANIASVQIVDNMSGKLTLASINVNEPFDLNVPDDVLTFEVTSASTSGDATVDMQWKSNSNGYTAITITKGSATLITSGVYVVFQSGVAYSTSDVATVETSADDLPDGDYAYRDRARAPDGGDYQSTGGDRPYLSPSDSQLVTVKNFDDLGARTKARTPTFTLVPNVQWESIVYRRDEGENDYFRVDTSKLPTPSGSTYSDTLRIVEMDTIDPLDQNDESEDALNAAIFNSSKGYVQIFAKDNRLWRVPQDRQDLLLYSRPGSWWGWQRENSFAFDSNIASIIEVRDPTTVGGTLTTVIFTETGIYHLVGSGTEGDPYTLTKQIDDIVVESNSIVNMNGILMFVTKSDTGAYNQGRYGQKVYEYDLQTLTEVSAKIQTDDVLISTTAIESAEMLGGDKYALKKANDVKWNVYHRDAQGWVTTDATNEIANTWSWNSKNFTTEMMARFKLGYARKFKIDYVGDITVTFNVWFDEPENAQTFTVNFSSTTRREEYHQLPPIKGSVWNMELSGTNATLYNMWLVR